MITTVLIFIVMLVLLIIVHEVGHLITAKLCGVKVQEFGIGFPPRLLGIKRGDTTYSINALPFGGFVRIVGEEDPHLPGGLAGKSPGIRFLVLSAGSVMNVVFPILLISLSLMIPHHVLQEDVPVGEVVSGSPAEKAGIEPGDIILKINDCPIQNRGDVPYLINLNLGSDINILLQKANLTQQEVTVRPRWNPPPDQGAIGIAVGKPANSTTITKSYPLWKAIPLGVQKCGEILVLFKNEVTKWLIRGIFPQLVGPIGIAQLTGEVAKGGISSLLEFAALISINLAIINLSPFPALDGGRIVFVVLEWIRCGKRISPKWESLVHLIGFAILISVVLVISYYDITRLIQREGLIP